MPGMCLPIMGTERVRSVCVSGLFERFFGDAKDWFQLMEQSQAVAFGPAVLDMLVPGNVPGSSKLQLAVWERLDRLGPNWFSGWRTFLRKAGYMNIDMSGSPEGRPRWLLFSNCERHLEVEFVMTDDEVQYIVDNVLSTHLMNVLTLEGIYCPFPDTTLRERRMVFMREPTAEEAALVGEFIDAGYVNLSRSRSDMMRLRRLGDDRTLFIPDEVFPLGIVDQEDYCEWLELLRRSRLDQSGE